MVSYNPWEDELTVKVRERVSGNSRESSVKLSGTELRSHPEPSRLITKALDEFVGLFVHRITKEISPPGANEFANSNGRVYPVDAIKKAVDNFASGGVVDKPEVSYSPKVFNFECKFEFSQESAELLKRHLGGAR